LHLLLGAKITTETVIIFPYGLLGPRNYESCACNLSAEGNAVWNKGQSISPLSEMSSSYSLCYIANNVTFTNKYTNKKLSRFAKLFESKIQLNFITENTLEEPQYS